MRRRLQVPVVNARERALSLQVVVLVPVVSMQMGTKGLTLAHTTNSSPPWDVDTSR